MNLKILFLYKFIQFRLKEILNRESWRGSSLQAFSANEQKHNNKKQVKSNLNLDIFKWYFLFSISENKYEKKLSDCNLSSFN